MQPLDEPRGDLRYIDVASRHHKHELLSGIDRLVGQVLPVEQAERPQRRPGQALVAGYEPTVPREGVQERGRLLRELRIRVVPEDGCLRPGGSGLTLNAEIASQL